MIRIDTFRGKEFVDREKEIAYLKSRFAQTPEEILWLYGPKSAGKTTLIEYLIEKELTNGLKFFDKYWIKYINFRRAMVGSYENFIDSFFETASKDDFTNEIKGSFDIGIFKLEAKVLEQVKRKEKNLFHELIKRLQRITKQKLIIIDEIQTLEDIYYNGERELLKEFLNFCVALTKELHIAHVVILSSNTVFIERIYNDAKLKVTSLFKKIDHLDKETTLEYLEYKGVSQNDKELIWNYLGGCIPLIQRLFYEQKEFASLQEYLEYQVALAKSEIVEIMRRFMDEKKRAIFRAIIKIIVDEGVYRSKEDEEPEYVEVIDFMSQNEIFFYDPLTQEVRGNNRLYEKAFEKLI